MKETVRDDVEPWYQFLWSYERDSQCAVFMRMNGFKTVVCSHTGTAYHDITTFLPSKAGFRRHKTCKSDADLEELRGYFD